MKKSILAILALGMLISFQLRADNTSALLNGRKIVVVSDIDDTIRFTRIHHKGEKLKYYLGLLRQRAFTAMPAVYHSMANRGVEFEYVSGTIQKLIYLPQKFLALAGFPVGELHDRQTLSQSLIDFKFLKTNELMRAHPDKDFVLIGDNGQYDIMAYQKIKNDPELGPRVKAILIHKIYEGENSSPLMEGQIPYFTSADMAAQLHLLGLTTAEELRQIARMVDSGVKSKMREVKLHTLPDPMRVLPSDIERLSDLSDSIADFEVRNLLRNISASIPMSALSCQDVIRY